MSARRGSPLPRAPAPRVAYRSCRSRSRSAIAWRSTTPRRRSCLATAAVLPALAGELTASACARTAEVAVSGVSDVETNPARAEQGLQGEAMIADLAHERMPARLPTAPGNGRRRLSERRLET